MPPAQKPHKLRKLALRLLKSISQEEGLTITRMAKYERLSVPTTSLSLHRLQRRGLITITPRGLFKELRLTLEGWNYLAIPVALKQRLSAQGGLTTTRMEVLRLKYQLKDPLEPNQPPEVLRLIGIKAEEVRWNNNIRAKFKIGDITAQLSTGSLELWAPIQYGTSKDKSIKLLRQAQRALDPIALKIEQRASKIASFKLKRGFNDTLISEIVDIELAEEEHAMAQAKPKEYKFEVHHPADGQLRAKIDYSRGIDRPEFEFTHRKTAPQDRDTLNKQFNYLFNGDVSLLDINRIGNSLDRTAQLLASQAAAGNATDARLGYYSEQIKAHAEAIQKLNSVLDKLDRKLAQEPQQPAIAWCKGCGEPIFNKGDINDHWDCARR